MEKNKDHPQGRILIVDDDQDARAIIESILIQEGFNVIQAGSGSEALKMIKADPPDLIILDIMMGDVDGYQVLRSLREVESYTDIPIILLTALSSNKEKIMGYKAGADDFISKPFNSDLLIGKIRALFRIKELQNELKKKNIQYQEAIGFVCHEMKNLLVSIGGFSERLLKGKAGDLNQKQKEILSTILNDTRLIERLIESFFNLKKLEESDDVISCSWINMKKDVILPVIEEFENQREFYDSSAEIEESSFSQDVLIFGDNELLKIVYKNLFSNALKYGEIDHKIVFSCHDFGDYAQFNVWNKGEEIQNEFRERIFEKFFRIDESRTRSIKGTGLCLYISKQIIEKHNGKIWVESGKNRGVNFAFSIPTPANKKLRI